MSDRVRELGDADFADAVRGGAALVDFHGAYCPPCKLLEPVVARIAELYAGRVLVAKVDVDDNFETAADNAIVDIPTVVLFRNGVEAARLFGMQDLATLQGEVEKLLV